MTEIQNVSRLINNIHRIGGPAGEQIIKAGVSRGTKIVQSEAKLLVPTNSGRTRNSIRTKVDGLKGSVYTNEPSAVFVEFGTGSVGASNHGGISPNVRPSYRNTPWWFHESMVEGGYLSAYNFFTIDTPVGKFYKTEGQAAQPFMYPALKNNRAKVLAEMEKYLSRKLKEITK